MAKRRNLRISREHGRRKQVCQVAPLQLSNTADGKVFIGVQGPHGLVLGDSFDPADAERVAHSILRFAAQARGGGTG